MNTMFEKDIIAGLSATNKFLHSKYFYDDLGSHIFQEIMEMPEYYLTDSEFEIFQNHTEDIYEKLEFQQHFNLIELGAGDGLKTAEIIRYLLENNVDFTYKPIDISQEANDLLSDKMKTEFPTLKIQPQTGDYFEILANIRENKDPSLLLFIGSNIGNYLHQDACQLVGLFNQNMKKGDKLIIGVDLKKNPLVIHQAYFDPHGITKRFNLNLLNRINREMQANFDLEKFDFYANYDPKSGEVKSYLISLCDQTVHLQKTDTTITFLTGEVIWTELSKKYDIKELEEIASKEGFTPVHHFLDEKKYFSDSLFEKK